MSVELSPATQLGFPRPFTAITKRTLYIHNPHSYPVAFKVKTTAPKQYSVRPNSGRIEPGDSVDVNIMLQPMAEEPPAHAKCKDKFLVQSAFIHADDEVRSLSQMWTLLEQTNKAGIEEKKLKVVFLAPEGQADGQGIPEEMEDSRIEESFNDPHDGLTRWTTKPEKEYDPALFPNKGLSVWEDPYNKPIYVPKAPVLHKPVTVGTHTQPPIHLHFCSCHIPHKLTCNCKNPKLTISKAIFSHAQTSPTPLDRSVGPSDPSRSFAAGPSAPAVNEPALPPLSAADIQPTNAALEKSLSATTSDSEKLAVALKEIERLKAEVAEKTGPQVTGLRKRGVQGGADTIVEKPVQAAAVAAQQGVPLEVVVGLVAGVFVLTYLFF
ncbi:hypothetical protein, variant 1 [Cryptococcus amylolentus CBS 6039]|uniref:MSP domain-containing protein n=1 Tax=Cryptococcus amylolentus CBS 6039 TaxID=1295533 RepID=A0A1E3HHL6_9TREE|nr:hypothetical protein L202_05837 [Cryptococcus amylolentus CBS 6039]XP_018991373.1 hypothetical protein, variant 1 [Cryptococcus amylolentus CBS 6039]ODN75841.1 hypothetical protein L202_05837 [Cryptococcus amylolentus CBS 6039]ODN75842.1 hypothetical protein, variant 1 [Cryptococcus amylolentus CBS 6039]